MDRRKACSRPPAPGNSRELFSRRSARESGAEAYGCRARVGTGALARPSRAHGAPVKPGVGLTGWSSSADGASHGPNLNLYPLCSMKRRSIRRGPAWMSSVWRSWRSSPSSPAFLPTLAVVPGATVKARVLRLSALPELFIVAQMLAYLLLLGDTYILVTKERGQPALLESAALELARERLAVPGGGPSHANRLSVPGTLSSVSQRDSF